MARRGSTALTPLARPAKTYSFTDFARLAPQAPVPGDRLDTELEELRSKLTACVDVLTGILNGSIALPDQGVTIDIPGLQPVFDAKVIDIATGQVSGGQRRLPVISPQIAMTPEARAAMEEANTAASDARAQADRAAKLAADTEASAIWLNRRATEVEEAARLTASFVATVSAHAEQAQRSATLLSNDENHAALAAFDADQAQQLAWKWAEWLSGPVMTEEEYEALDPDLIPPGYVYNPVTGMGTAGLWSSKWWAVKAQQIVSDGVEDIQGIADSALASADAASESASEAAASAGASASSAADALESANDAADSWDEFSDLYLGSGTTGPTTDPDGDPLQTGALFFNTSLSAMTVWDGDSWEVIASGGGGGSTASSITFVPTGGIAATNVQTAIVELDTEKINDAPADGTYYSRRNNAWAAGTVDLSGYAQLTGAAFTGAVSSTGSITGASLVATGAITVGTEIVPDTNDGASLGSASAQFSDVWLAEGGKIDWDNGDATLTQVGNLLTLAGAEFVNAADPVQTLGNATKGYVDTGLGTKANSSHTHAQSDITGLTAALALLAPLASPALTGTPTAPTASPGDDDTSIATTAFVTAAINVIKGGVSASFDTLSEIVANFANYAALAGAAFTGNLSITKATPALALNHTSVTDRTIEGQTNGTVRWRMKLGESTAEGGSNAGSNFSLASYNDAGTLIETVMSIVRSTGVMTLSDRPVFGANTPWDSGNLLGKASQSQFVQGTADYYVDAAKARDGGAFYTLPTSGTMGVNGNNGINFECSPTGTLTFDNPTNIPAGRSGVIVINSSAGDITMDFGTAFYFPNSQPTTRTALKTGVVTYIAYTSSLLYCTYQEDWANT